LGKIKIILYWNFIINSLSFFSNLRILGLNGAGKTTLIKMLVGELKSTSGTIYINGFDINKSYINARQNLGYCPQFSYLPEFLLVQQCLELFADLKGLDPQDITDILEDLIRLFRLGTFRYRMVQHLRFILFYPLLLLKLEIKLSFYY
jgi:ABC-type multidrug transport system ATPase subunit